MKFVSLNQGKFYVTAILKEYEFDQAQVGVELGDGEHAEKVLVAKRIAFSAFGSVTKLSGVPLEHARVVATCENCDRIEETTLDKDGGFRIRGLIPAQTYKIQVHSDLIERTVPNQHKVEVEPKDQKGFEFLAIMQSPYIEVSGSVNFEGEDPKAVFREDPQAIVELYEADSLEKPVRVQQLTLSRYFQFSFLERKQHLLRVVPKRGPTDKRYEATSFNAEENGGFHKLVVPSVASKKGDINRSALLGPIILALGLLAFFMAPRIKQLINPEDEVSTVRSPSNRRGQPGRR